MYISTVVLVLLVLAATFLGALLGRYDGETRAMYKYESKRYKD